MKRLQKRWLPLGVVAVLGAAATVAGIQFNPTASLPLGFYRATSPLAPSSPGAILRFCMTPDQVRQLARRPYIRPGRCAGGTQEIAKIVVGVPGDRVRTDSTHVWVNGVALRDSRTYTTDSYGRGMPHARYGEITLGPGEYWVHGPYVPRSLDSRVFGPIRKTEIRGGWVPVWTWPARTGSGAPTGLRGRT